MDDQTLAALNRYVTDLFAAEDTVLESIQAETLRHEMPQISLAPQEGRLLQFLLRAVGARKAVEIGTLAGYSGTWLARALPEDGKLYTLEVNPKHAAVARSNFERAGLNGRIELIEGPALESLNRIEPHGPFDFVFIDANKDGYPDYLGWAVQNLRQGGIVAAHNALRGGRVAAPRSEDDLGMHNFNRMLAAESQLFSTILSVGDGMAVGIKQ